MTLQQLDYIVAVDKYRHFVKAVDSCGITQSTLSSMIQKLETELDVIIFDRNSHPIRPTILGEEIIRQAKIVLYNASQIEELVAIHKNKSVGAIRLGIATTIAPYVLPKLFRYMSVYNKDICLHIEEARVNAIIEKIEKAELDVALLATPVEKPELLEIPIYHERFVAYVSPKDKLYNSDILNTSELSPKNIWVLRESYCPNKGVFPFCGCDAENAAIYEAGSIDTLVKIVDENGGYTIIPELHIPMLNENQLKNIIYIPYIVVNLIILIVYNLKVRKAGNSKNK